MSDYKVLSKRQVKKQRKLESGYLGQEHRYMFVVYYILEIIIQLTFFIIFYTAFIQSIRINSGNNLGYEFLFVFCLMLITDIIAIGFIFSLRTYINYRKKLLRREKKRSGNPNRKAIEYLLYTLFRSFCYVIGLIGLLSSLLMPYIPILWGFFAYFIAWFTISLCTKILAFIISIGFTKTV